MKQDNVCAIVVTYNRKEMLVETINGLLKQDTILNTIYLIDNNSSDNTKEFLKQKGFVGELKDYDNYLFSNVKINEKDIKYYRLKENIGGSGGFNFGLNKAYEDERGFNWFWLMDDDVEPLDNALIRMLEFKEISECIVPSKRAKDGEILHWWGWLNLRNLREYPIPEKNFREGFAYVNMMCFEGVLISRNIVNKIGFPDIEFFIYGDDLVYGFKASKFTNNIYLTEPLFLKKLKKKNFHKRFGKYFPFASMGLSYYLMRNYLLKAKKIRQFSPNEINMKYVYLYHFYYFFKQLLKAIFIEFNFKKPGILLRGFIDSFKIIKKK